MGEVVYAAKRDGVECTLSDARSLKYKVTGTCTHSCCLAPQQSFYFIHSHLPDPMASLLSILAFFYLPPKRPSASPSRLLAVLATALPEYASPSASPWALCRLRS